MNHFEHLDDVSEIIETMLSEAKAMGGNGHVEILLLSECAEYHLCDVSSGSEVVKISFMPKDGSAEFQEIFLSDKHLPTIRSEVCCLSDHPLISGLDDNGEAFVIKFHIDELNSQGDKEGWFMNPPEFSNTQEAHASALLI